MIGRQVTTVIDAGKCTGCGLCVEICPADTLTMREGKAVVTGDIPFLRPLRGSLSSRGDNGPGRCSGGISVRELHRRSSLFATRGIRHSSTCPPDVLEAFVPQIQGQAVGREILEDLVKIGITAPSGTNSQVWTFTLLSDRKAIAAFGKQVALFFKEVNKAAENAFLRASLRLIGRKELSDYYRDYYESVKKAMDEWEKMGRDRLFHGATAAIVVASRPGGSTSKEDALLAAQNILLVAHSVGLESCLIGYAVVSLSKDIRIKRFLGS